MWGVGFLLLVHFSPRSLWEALPILAPAGLAGAVGMGLSLAVFGRFHAVGPLRR